MQYRKRLRYTGGLMVLSMLLLGGFLYTWLKSQYRDEQTLLRKDLISLYAGTQQKIIDSLLDHELAKVMSGDFSEKMKGTKFKSSFHVSISDSSEDNFSFSKRDQQIVIDGSNADSITMYSGITSGLRTILLKATEKMTDSSFLKLDSMELKKSFERALKQNNLPVNVSWKKGKKDMMAIALPGISPAVGEINISNYQGVLLRRMLPQAAFSLVLFLLCCSASILAYQTIRRQARLSRQKDDLISNISHELKTPVATAKVALEALNNYNALEDPARTRDYLQIAGREIERLEQLTGNILNQMQLEQGKINFYKEPLDISAMIGELLLQLKPAMEQAGSHCITDLSQVPESVPGDKLHIRGALYNVLDNALKYGGDRISVTGYTEGAQLHLCIADNGPGIPAEYREKIFERFFRVPQGNRHDVKGYGLGLNYTRYVIRGHNGQIKVYSGKDGTGTVFELILPTA